MGLVRQDGAKPSAGAEIEVLEVGVHALGRQPGGQQTGVLERAEHLLGEGGDTAVGGVDAHATSLWPHSPHERTARVRHPSVARRAYPEGMATRRTTTTAPYRCTECGWTALKWVGRCGECQQWGTVVEASEPTGINRSVTAVAPVAERAARPITAIDTRDTPRRTTGVGEFDRVLGGGIVPGAAILLSGEPGVGKSTLLLEVAAQSARSGRRVLYASAEESTAQVRLRAERTGALHDELYLAAETDLATILGHVDQVKPELLIVDSVQTVSSSMSEGMAGHPSQVREVASTLIRIAKDRGLPVIIVGHVTKDGSIAGPRILEHLVDVVCQFEGDRQTSLRFVRALKNRFGPTDEVGCFDMTGAGIAEVADPSALFLGHGRPIPEPASRSRSRAGARCPSRCRRSRSRRRRRTRGGS